MPRQNEHLNVKTNKISLQIKNLETNQILLNIFFKFGVFHHLIRNFNHFVTTSHAQTYVKTTHEHNFHATNNFYATRPTTLYDSIGKHTVKNCKSDAKPWSTSLKFKFDDFFFDKMRPPRGGWRLTWALGKARTPIWPKDSAGEYGLGRTCQPYIKTALAPGGLIRPRRWPCGWRGTRSLMGRMNAWVTTPPQTIWSMDATTTTTTTTTMGAKMTTSEITFWD